MNNSELPSRGTGTVPNVRRAGSTAAKSSTQTTRSTRSEITEAAAEMPSCWKWADFLAMISAAGDANPLSHT